MGTVRMGLDKYPWADRYGWTADRYGVEWQLILSPRAHKITPAFLFVDSLFGRGEEALKYYVSLFPNSKIETVAKDEKTGTILHSSFTLNGQGFALMEGQGTHGFTFNEAFSIMVKCDDQTEIDRYWEQLSAGGAKSRCGWLKDKFGVSWQIVPAELDQWMDDPARGDRVMKALLKMQKLDVTALKNA